MNVTRELLPMFVFRYKLMVLHMNASNYKQRVAIILNPIEHTESFVE